MSDTTLIVPIAAQVLVVYDANKHKKLNLSARLTENSILGIDNQYNLSDLLDDSNIYYFEKGVHLHWKLPKILKHGISDNNNDLVFPPVPNRWMVVRYKTNINEAKNIPAKAWVIKSDALDEEGKNNNWVVLESVYEADYQAPNGSMVEKQNFVFKAVGTSDLLNPNYSETDTNPIDITAVGAANPYFSAIYDDCKDVFGFHDVMDDAANNDVFSYVVTGWYSDPKNDPFDPNTKIDTSLVEKIRKNWVQKVADEKPSKTLFSHTLYGVIWNNTHQSSIPIGDVNVCLGQTTVEALSAYLKTAFENKIDTLPLEAEKIEPYLNALFNHLIEDDKQDISIEKIHVENHKKQFSPKSRGILWELKKIEKDNAQEEESIPFFPQDEGLVKQLKTLNAAQVSFNEKTAALASVRQEYYFNWYKIVLTKTTPKKDATLKDKETQLKGEIDNIKQEMGGLKSQIEANIFQIGQNENIKIPSQSKPNARYELVQVNENVFSQPTEPAVLLYGAGLGDVKNFYQDINDVLACRLSTQIIDKIIVQDIPCASGNIFGTQLQIANTITQHEAIKKLMYEAFILDPQLAPFTAIVAEGTSREKDSTIIARFVEQKIIPAQADAKKGIEPYACKEYTQAWEPIFMLWEAEYTEGVTQQAITCQGLSPITDGIAKTLTDIAPKADCTQIISQNLSGFNKYLLAQIPSLQLPPIAYSEDAKGNFDTNSFKLDKATLDILGNQNEVYALAPNPQQQVFSPIREGQLAIKKLSLVDGFGQQKIVMDKLVPKHIITAQGLDKVEKPDKDETLVHLPKRIVQPTRLHFDWVNTNNEILYQDTGKMDHPIMGWLVPDFLDNMVIIYDRQGQEVKALKWTDRKNKIEEFYPSKDGKLSQEEIQQEREAQLDPQFKEIIDGLNLSKFIEDANNLKKRISKGNNAVSSSAVSMLYGTPIAIAKGKISLELLGNPTKNPSWGTPDNVIGNINTLALSLKIGDKKQKDDGLLGYFIGNDYKTLYDTSTSPAQRVLPTGQNSIDITVLLTANAGFYLTTTENLLPAQYIKLFPHAVEDLSKNISISFMLCPFMSDKKQSYIPTPNTPDSTWNWIHKSAVNIWENPSSVNQNSQQESFDFSEQQFYEGWIKMEAVHSKK